MSLRPSRVKVNLHAQFQVALPTVSSTPSAGVKGKPEHQEQVRHSPNGERAGERCTGTKFMLPRHFCPCNTHRVTTICLEWTKTNLNIPNTLFMSISKRVTLLLHSSPKGSVQLFLSSPPNLSQSLKLFHCASGLPFYYQQCLLVLQLCSEHSLYPSALIGSCFLCSPKYSHSPVFLPQPSHCWAWEWNGCPLIFFCCCQTFFPLTSLKLLILSLPIILTTPHHCHHPTLSSLFYLLSRTPSKLFLS